MDALRNAIRSRGSLAKISLWSGINQTTISRIARGITRNPGIETIHKIEAAIRRLDAERSAKTKSSVKADEKQTKSRKSDVAAKAGA